MKLVDVYAVIAAAYPKRLSDDYVKACGGHDNSGMLVDVGDEIKGAVFSLDLSQGAIAAAAAPHRSGSSGASFLRNARNSAHRSATAHTHPSRKIAAANTAARRRSPYT